MAPLTRKMAEYLARRDGVDTPTLAVSVRARAITAAVEASWAWWANQTADPTPVPTLTAGLQAMFAYELFNEAYQRTPNG
jgi:hypothetical protein